MLVYKKILGKIKKGFLHFAYETLNVVPSSIHVTCFSSISYCSNSEYWPLKRTQSGNIHSIILYVHVGW